MGYHRAGFDEIVGVDSNPQPRYPFEFHQADAMGFSLDGFDLIHASPPCQKFSVAQTLQKNDHPDLLTPTRKRLHDSDTPYVIENVPGAPMRRDAVLCGSMFGLAVRRHRLFEISRPIAGLTPPHQHNLSTVTVFGHCVEGLRRGQGQRKHLGVAVGREAMGIDWMTLAELSEAIPPAYTEWIGQQFMGQ